MFGPPVSNVVPFGLQFNRIPVAICQMRVKPLVTDARVLRPIPLEFVAPACALADHVSRDPDDKDTGGNRCQS